MQFNAGCSKNAIAIRKLRLTNLLDNKTSIAKSLRLKIALNLIISLILFVPFFNAKSTPSKMISFIELWSQPWLSFSNSKSISQIINPNHSSKNSLFLTDEFDDSLPEDGDGNKTSITIENCIESNPILNFVCFIFQFKKQP